MLTVYFVLWFYWQNSSVHFTWRGFWR